MSTDYIPQGDSAFLTWVKNLFAYLVVHAINWNINPSTWMHIDPPMITAYDDALTKAKDPNRGKADVLLKNETRNVLKTAVRKYVKEHLEYNSLISDDDRKRLGLPVHDTKPTPVSDPTTFPVAAVKHPSPGVIEVNVTDSESGRKAKPAGIHGFELAWGIFETPPTDWGQLNHSSFCTRTPLRLTFSGNERGKTLYFALRWENKRGVKGPWTEILNAIVP
jgi:hypothetical protein